MAGTKTIRSIIAKNAAFLSVLFMAQAAVANDAPLPEALDQMPSCTDSDGTPVRYVPDTADIKLSHLIHIAGARYLQPDAMEEPAIVYQPKRIRSLSFLERAFTWSHECYHLSSGDTRAVYRHYNEHGRAPDTDQMERDADCDAARRLRTDYGYSGDDLENLQDLLLKAESKLANERMVHIRACFFTQDS